MPGGRARARLRHRCRSYGYRVRHLARTAWATGTRAEKPGRAGGKEYLDVEAIMLRRLEAESAHSINLVAVADSRKMRSKLCQCWQNKKREQSESMAASHRRRLPSTPMSM